MLNYIFFSYRVNDKDLPAVFIGNIPTTMTEDSLNNLISDYGTVMSLFVGKPKADNTTKWAIARIKDIR